MTRATTLMVGAAVGWLSVGAVSQPPATFSGRWTAEAVPVALPPAGPRVTAPGDMGSGWGPTLTITQEATRLVVESVVYSRYDLQPPLRLVYALDGSESQNTLMVGRGAQVQVSRAAWTGSSLSITTRHTYLDPTSGTSVPTDVTQTLTLESPTMLVIEASSSGAGAPASTTRTVYRSSP